MENDRLIKRRILLLMSLLVMVTLIPIAALSGVYKIDVYTLFYSRGTIMHEIFINLRLPRIVLALLLGGSLSWSGAIMQGLFRNPIVDPGLAGITAGASLFAGVGIVFGHFLPFLSSMWSLVVFSFFGSLVTGFSILFLARQNGKSEVYNLLLIGIAVNAICYSAIGLLSYIANDAQLRNLSFWNLGSLGGANWNSIGHFGPFLILPIFFSPFLYRKFNAFSLGEPQAFHLGISVESLKNLSLVLIGISVGAAVSLTGTINFVGIVVPHMVRLLIGQDYKFLLPITYILGGSLLLLSDTISRTILAPTEIPVGIITALIGAPFFLFILYQNRKGKI
ncbi:FecCD family ABC transporter permease [Leptospira ognonensis]|nr:iron ABC transporter permease [Leptospira ognonensis]